MNIAKNMAITLAAMSLFSSTLTSAGPLISIGSMYEVLNSDQRSLAKRVYNNGDTNAYVRVDVMQINPTVKDSETPVKTLKDAELVKDRLLVTPMRMIIPPNNFQTSRILWSGQRDIEQYYRVRYTPVLPVTNDGFGLDDKEIKDYRNKTVQAGVNVLAGYGTVVIVQPSNPKFNTRMTQQKNSIEIANMGNATVIAEDIKICKTNMNQCDASTRAFVLPGQTYTIKKQGGGSISFSLQEGSQRRPINY
ncbi:hypothetical protein [Enterobacter sp. CC120223-11]|uniref:hypothetical protein n=1 Tax=Enterobacter sp. CC120223-11 TaxID=1378073 RepID=UPI000BDC81C5|nr:hypothetical protein [Enterobacter sp. CC120223-11]SNY69778.1 hypothetical protein SAMN02744775_02210 [Enterobacter sp. CC120223-11]